MKKNLVIMGMISALLSSPFSSILACENESVWSMAASDKKPPAIAHDKKQLE